jgi:hypothetical protein
MVLKWNVCYDNRIEDLIKIKKISLIEKIADILKEV